MKKILRFAKIIAMSVSVIWGAVLFGNVLTANADDTATETVNIVDTNGNTLRAPQTIPVGDGKNPINVNISGYDPAETLEKIDTTFVYPSGSDTPSGTITFTIDDDKQVAHITVSSGDESHDGGYQTKDDIEKTLGVKLRTINEGLAKSMDKTGGVYFYTPGEIPELTLKNLKKAIFTVTYKGATIPVEYVDSNGTVVGNDTITGIIGKTGSYTPIAPKGYQLVDTKTIAYDIAKITNPTIKIPVTAKAPVVPSPGGGSSTIVTPTTPVTPTPSNPTPKPTPQPAEPTIPNYAAKKGAAVYAIKGIYLYRSANFTKSRQLAKYPKVKRVNRPMFVVTDYARSNGGALRYKVRDVNHGSKTAGKVGYITANSKFVVPVYYQSLPKNKKITIINKRGVNAYKNANLTGKVKHYQKGARLTVKKIVKHNLTTRYQLSNGHYVTGNKKLVIQGNY